MKLQLQLQIRSDTKRELQIFLTKVGFEAEDKVVVEKKIKVDDLESF